MVCVETFFCIKNADFIDLFYLYAARTMNHAFAINDYADMGYVRGIGNSVIETLMVKEHQVSGLRF